MGDAYLVELADAQAIGNVGVVHTVVSGFINAAITSDNRSAAVVSNAVHIGVHFCSTAVAKPVAADAPVRSAIGAPPHIDSAHNDDIGIDVAGVDAEVVPSLTITRGSCL